MKHCFFCRKLWKKRRYCFCFLYYSYLLLFPAVPFSIVLFLLQGPFFPQGVFWHHKCRIPYPEGHSYTVKVDYGDEEYPTRDYGEYTFPAGHYRSLRVTIGEGEGQNWWCVLFPPLCLDIATDTVPNDDALQVGLSPGEQAIITDTGDGGYRVKLKTLELLEGVFSRRRK